MRLPPRSTTYSGVIAVRVRVANKQGELDWRDQGPANGYAHPWNRQRRTIDEQLIRAMLGVRRVRLPQVTVAIERA